MKTRRIVGRVVAVAVVVAGGTLAVAAPAYAFPMTKVYVSGTDLVVDDMGTGSDVSVVITASKGGWHVTGLNIYPYAGCSFVSGATPTRIFCANPINAIRALLGTGDDTVDIDPGGTGPAISYSLYGDDGNDVLRGGRGSGLYFGGSGDDVLEGRGGDDFFYGYAGADRMLGGPGADTVVYDEKTVGVHVSLDGVDGDDGTAGEGDTVGADVERIFGSNEDDVLIGNSADNTMIACRGSDAIYGLGGNDSFDPDMGCPGDGSWGADLIDGGTGVDTLSYDNDVPGDVYVYIDLDNAYGDDGFPGEGDSNIDIENITTRVTGTLVGNAGPNVLQGSPFGPNKLNGGGGNDILIGGAYADEIFGEDGNDTLRGGSGSDKVYGGPGMDQLDAGPGGTLVDGGLHYDICVATTTVVGCEVVT